MVVVDATAMPSFIGKLIGSDPGTALSQAKAAAPSSVTVRVINDTNSNGLEKTNAEALQAAGFKTEIPPATSDVVAKTLIRYAPGQEAAAKALQVQVPGAVLERDVRGRLGDPGAGREQGAGQEPDADAGARRGQQLGQAR